MKWLIRLFCLFAAFFVCIIINIFMPVFFSGIVGNGIGSFIVSASNIFVFWYSFSKVSPKLISNWNSRPKKEKPPKKHSSVNHRALLWIVFVATLLVLTLIFIGSNIGINDAGKNDPTMEIPAQHWEGLTDDVISANSHAYEHSFNQRFPDAFDLMELYKQDGSSASFFLWSKAFESSYSKHYAEGYVAGYEATINGTLKEEILTNDTPYYGEDPASILGYTDGYRTGHYDASGNS